MSIEHIINYVLVALATMTFLAALIGTLLNILVFRKKIAAWWQLKKDNKKFKLFITIIKYIQYLRPKYFFDTKFSILDEHQSSFLGKNNFIDFVKNSIEYNNIIEENDRVLGLKNKYLYRFRYFRNILHIILVLIAIPFLLSYFGIKSINLLIASIEINQIAVGEMLTMIFLAYFILVFFAIIWLNHRFNSVYRKMNNQSLLLASLLILDTNS